MRIDRQRRQILRELASGAKDFWQLATRCDGSLFELTLSVEELLREGVVVASEGKLSLAKELGVRSFRTKCERCGVGLELSDFEKLHKEFKELVRGRPEPLEGGIGAYDQGYVTELDAVRRFAFMWERGDVEDCELVLIGDDDMMSLLLGLSELPRKVVVLEIDERIVDFINRKASEQGLEVVAQRYDVRQPLPKEHSRSYDVFLTDPLETLLGFKLFLARCGEVLRGEGCAGYFGLTRLEVPMRRWRIYEKFLLDMGFAITDVLRDFNAYDFGIENALEALKYLLEHHSEEQLRSFEAMGLRRVVEASKPEELWYKSCFFRVELTTEGVSSEFEGLRFEGDIYSEG